MSTLKPATRDKLKTISTPTVAITTMVIQTCFSTLKRSEAPPSNRM